MILTARIPDRDIAFFDELRRTHFPRDRNQLKAHLTIFHRISDRHLSEARQVLTSTASGLSPMQATCTEVSHLGFGVAVNVVCKELEHVRETLCHRLDPWLSSEDLRAWRPHITIQNSVPRSRADRLFSELKKTYETRTILITGFDLWHYRGGPWSAEASFFFP